MSVYEDIVKFRTLLNNEAYNCGNGKMQVFDPPYMFCTESIYEYLSYFNINKKAVLTTGSSGDQVLYCLLFGANDVTCFDINPFGRYIFDLKVAFIKTYDYDTFKSHVFGSDYGVDSLLSPEFYKEVCHNLPKTSRTFWDKAFADGLNTYDVIHFSGSYGRSLKYLEYFNNKTAYQKLRNVLLEGNYSTEFITTQLQDIHSFLPFGKKFDFIMLSNIIDYVYCWETGNREENAFVFNEVVTKLIKDNLNDEGIIQLGYSWNTSDKYSCNSRSTLIGKFLPNVELKTKPLSGDEMFYYTCKSLKRESDGEQHNPNNKTTPIPYQH